VRVVGRVDEATEDHGLKPVLEQGLDLAHGALQLVVVLGGDGLGAPRELQQLAPRRLAACPPCPIPD
jgi:hypothetical protein